MKYKEVILYSICFALVWSNVVLGQSFAGKVLDATTQSPLQYVNIGILGGNAGTVSNDKGEFQIVVNEDNKADTLRLSLLGYSTVDLLVSEIQKRQQNDTLVVLLQPATIVLKEIEVSFEKYKQLIMGTPAKSRTVNAGFFNNNLGHEIGSLFKYTGSDTVVLDSVQLNFAKCIYEQIFLRLNVYEVATNGKYIPVLQKPIYVSFSCREALKNPFVNLQDQGVRITSHFVVSVELVKDLGKKGLYFFADLNDPINPGVYRQTSQSDWRFIQHKEKPVGISIRSFLH